MKRDKGSALVEYVLPTALIGIVVGLGLFYMTSNGGMENFFASNNNSKIDSTTQKMTIDENKNDSDFMLNPPKGSLGGTPDTPVKQCSNGICNIDYGTYLLSGIPEDFNEFIRTSGVSGGSDKIQQLMTQIATQLEGSEDDELASDILKLANIGHNIALIQNTLEKQVLSCNGETECINNFRQKSFPKPAGYIDSACAYPTEMNYEKAIYAGSIGDANFHMNRPVADSVAENKYYDYDLSLTLPNYQYYQQYKKVIESTTTNKEVLGVIKELTWNIGGIGEDFQNNYNYLTGDTDQSMYDPVTGERTVNVPAPTGYDLSSFENYNASKITHFDSALICASDANYDTGAQCH